MTLYLDDKMLTKRLLAGDESAFERFFEDNYARLYRFALGRLQGDNQAAEDIAQATLAKALQKIAGYRAESAMFTWLCAICRNEMSDWLRKQGRQREHIVLIEDHPEVAAAVDSISMPVTDSPETSYQRLEASRLIQVALDRLPPNYGDVLEWKYIEGFSVKEIAAKLNIGDEAAQSLIALAKRAFADVYTTLTKAMQTHSGVTVRS
ncbi:MAG TPA: RNA polymerase sigma factor [Woeseiaceae bacterium]|nr:RNA polymerase sigma factor [Woeseiaceae bacterium]